MKTALAIVTATLLACSAAFGQGAATNTTKKSDSKNTQAPQKAKASKVALNPQPLPPGPQATGKKTSAESKVALNPQPLPPKVQKTSQKKTAPAATGKKGAPGPISGGSSTQK